MRIAFKCTVILLLTYIPCSFLSNESISLDKNFKHIIFKPNTDIEIAKTKIKAGERKRVDIKLPNLFDHTKFVMPTYIINGKEEGPVLFISAAIHGDELISTEIVNRLLQKDELNTIKGTLIAVPIVNPYGYNNNTRYLPDNSDLNRMFPGKENGKFAERIANIFNHEILSKAKYGIDIHSAPVNRTNLPQIHISLNDKEELRLAKAFNPPVIVNSQPKNGKLRRAGQEKDIKVILFEGGEGLRFNEDVINTCLQGLLNVMAELGMLPTTNYNKNQNTAVIAKTTHWLRANTNGSIKFLKGLGDKIQKNENIAVISNYTNNTHTQLNSPFTGIIIGITTLPLVYEGTPLLHIAITE